MNREELLERPLPSNEDAEKCILGAVILDNKYAEEVARQLLPSDFYNPVFRMVYRAMLELYQERLNIDPISISENFRQRGHDIGSIGGVSMVTNFTYGLPHFSNIDDYIAIVKQHSVARDTIRLFNQVTNELLLGESSMADLLEHSESKLLTLSNRVNAESLGHTDRGFWNLTEITPALEQQFQNYHKGIATGTPTGMPELDKLLDGGGLQRGGVYLVGAVEKSGKTSLALDWAQYGAVVLGLTVPIVTLEMSKENMAKRLYSAFTGIPYHMFRPGLYDSPNDNTYTRAIEGLKEFGKFPIKIADRLFGLPEIARNLRRVVEQGVKDNRPVGYAIIDYLQLVEPDKAGKTRENEVSNTSRSLKKLAMELDIALVAMSSFNREGLREGQEPTPFNLRDSGALAFDCEALILLHNPAYVPGKPYEPKQITDMTMILSRQRNGPTGRIPMKFIGPYMQFMTESQFRKHFQGTGFDDLPQSLGQATMEDRERDLLWDKKEIHEEDTVNWD